MKQIITTWAILAFFAFSVLAQTADQMAQAVKAEEAARDAYKTKAFPEFLTQMETANRSRPNHPRLVYNLAVALALNGKTAPALEQLDRLAAMGLTYSLDKDEDLGALAISEKFAAIQARMAENRKPVNESVRALSLPDKLLITESVAFNAKTGVFYLSSVHQRKIVAVDKNGAVSEFSSPADGLWSVLGMKVDLARGWLWVCTSALPQMRGYDAADKGRSGIFKYDLRTGKLVKKYVLADAGHALGDLEIGRDGSIYATDSSSPVIYKLDSTSDAIEEFVRSDNFASLQGITLSRDELYIADYSKGIFRVDLASKKITQLKPANSVTVLGIDGLYYYRGKLIAIQNGVNPNRVIALTISGDRIDSYKTLEANHSDFMEPTLGVLVGEEFYYVANSQWPLVNEKAELNADKARSPIVLKIDAKKALAK